MELESSVIPFPALQQWRDKGSFLRINGAEIFYLDEGEYDQPALLLIHGFPTSSWDWQPMWHTLREQYRVVCLDMLGFGFSDKPNARNYSIHQQADIVEAVVEHVELDA